MRLAAAFVLAAAACGSSSSPTKPAPGSAQAPAPAAAAIDSADAAIDRFIAAWATQVRPTIPGHPDPLIGTIDRSMREVDARPRYSATLGPCREGNRTMADLIAQTGYDFVLYGSMAAADRHDRCWTVLYICCMKGDAGGQLDPATGELLVVWRIPEG